MAEAHFCRVCIGAVVFCGVEVSLLLPAAWVPRWVLHLSSGATYSRPLRRYPQMRSLLVPAGRSGPESKLGATRAFARALPPPHFLPPRTSHPPGPRLAAPATSPQSQQHRPFLPAPRGRRRFLFLPWLGDGWPLFSPLSWAGLPIPAPKEPGESAPKPAAPSASFFPPPTALQDEKWTGYSRAHFPVGTYPRPSKAPLDHQEDESEPAMACLASSRHKRVLCVRETHSQRQTQQSQFWF